MTKNELMTENTILANNYNIVHDALDKMNETIDELHNKIDAQDKIINNQALEIARLKEQINIYENPDDLTLMFMWCDEKAKNKIKKLQQAKDKLQNDYQEARDRIDEFKLTITVQQQQIDELINRIDKAIEFLHNNTMIGHCKEHYELLEILGDKENE